MCIVSLDVCKISMLLRNAPFYPCPPVVMSDCESIEQVAEPNLGSSNYGARCHFSLRISNWEQNRSGFEGCFKESPPME